MQIPPPLPVKQSRELVKYFFYLAFFLISVMFVLGLHDQDYQSFENMAWLIVGTLAGALKLQTNSTN